MLAERDHRYVPVDFNPFSGGEIERIIPISESQLEIWLACAFGGDDGNCAYNESISLHFEGYLDREALTAAIQAMVTRHEALRCTFSNDGEQIYIYREKAAIVRYENLTLSTPHEQKEWLDALGEKEATEPFDLKNGPLVRFHLIKLSANAHILWMTAHHIICDGWSYGVILEELSSTYSAFVQGNAPQLQAPFPLSGYVHELARHKATDSFHNVVKYWVNKLTPTPPPLNLPIDKLRNDQRTSRSRRHDVPLEPGLVTSIKRLGVSNGISFVNTLLVAFEVFLNRLTDESDIVVGLPTAGQAATGHFNLVGHCVNFLPIRSKIDTSLSFIDHLSLRRSQLLDDYDNQLVSYGSLLKALKIKRDNSRAPFIPVVFNVDIGMDMNVGFHGLNHTLTSNPRSFGTFELVVNATEKGDSFMLEWAYHVDLFEASTIKWMTMAFDDLLRKITSSPHIRIDKIVLPWNNPTLAGSSPAVIEGGAISYDADCTVLDLIVRQTAVNPQGVAMIAENQIVTYGELQEKTDRLADQLLHLGVGRGTFVTLFLEKSIDTVIAILSVLKAGAAYVPIDISYPEDRIRYILTDTDTRFVLTQTQHKGTIEKVAMAKSHVHCLDELMNRIHPSELTLCYPTREDLAYAIYTSGTTGAPKGVLVDHGALANYIQKQSQFLEIGADECILQFSNYSFDASVEQLFIALTSGVKLAVPSQNVLMDVHALGQFLDEKEVTHVHATPSFLELIPVKRYRKLRRIVSAGERCSHKLAKSWSPHVIFINKYGPTESTISTHAYKYPANAAVPPSASVPIGSALPGVIQRIINEKGEIAAIGELGELYVGGDQLSRGYLNQPKLTAERFIDYDGKRMYRTGDLVKQLPDGNIEYIRRVDEQLKLRGYRIELGEIEHRLGTLPGIKEAIVEPKQSLKGDVQLVAYVIEDDDSIDSQFVSWKDRWDFIYDSGVQVNNNKEQIRDSIFQQLGNSEALEVQAEEWRRQTIDRIKQLKAASIMEVGSGAGQILVEIAPEATRYVATDYSQSAIEKLNEELSRNPEKWKHVTTNVAPADHFEYVPPTSLDLVIINSVAQYFPDASYLINVIQQAANVIKPGGCIFVGDMQGKNSLELCHAFDQLNRSGDDMTVGQFNEVVSNRVRMEEELVADPGFFYLLPRIVPAITAVDVQLRKGILLNETTNYHYDVWLYVNSSRQVEKYDERYNWCDVGSVDHIKVILDRSPQQIICISGIPNRRTSKDIRLAELLAESDESCTIGKIKSWIGKIDEGILPDVMWELGEQYCCNTHVRWTSDGTDGCFEVVFVPGLRGAVIPERPAAMDLAFVTADHFVRKPYSKADQSASVDKSQSDRWKTLLEQSLPGYMIPQFFVAMKRFPLTPNHKVDRKALPMPVWNTAGSDTAKNMPTTDVEKRIAKIWSESLGAANIGLDDDFFELGGHSLIAVKMMAAIEREFGKRLPLASLFEYASVRRLARLLEGEYAPIKWDCLVPIKPAGAKPPLYIVHGAGLNVMLFNALSEYLDDDQPIYGLQAKGLNGEDEPFYSIEEMATHYISEIRNQNPEGPYLLAGYSLGGIIAHEMARQLIKLGKKVKMLAMLDTFVGNQHPPSNKVEKHARKAKHLLLNILYSCYMLLKDPKDTFLYKWKNIKRSVKQRYWSLVGKADTVVGAFGYLNKIDKINAEARRRYVIEPIDMEIDVFRATTQRFYAEDMQYLGWRAYALKGVRVHHIPGDHNKIFKPPYHQHLSKSLQRVINEKVSESASYSLKRHGLKSSIGSGFLPVLMGWLEACCN